MRPRALIFTVSCLGAASATALGIAACSGGGSAVATPPSGSPTVAPLGCHQTTMSPLRQLRARTGVIAVRPPAIEPNAKLDIEPGIVAIRLASADARRVANVASLLHGLVMAGPNAEGVASIALPANGDPVAAVRRIREIPGIVTAGPIVRRYTSQVVPNDPDLGTLPYDVTNPSVSNPRIEWDMYAMDLPDAWALPTGFGSPAVRLAIIDTGYDMTNPDLMGGRVAKSIVFDKPDGTPDQTASAQDYDGHGTDTTGIGAADTNNSTDAAGVAGSISLLEARVFPTPTAQNPDPPADTINVAAAINWAVANGAKVINLSLGSGTADPTYEEPAVESAIAQGVIVVAAAGNGNSRGVGQPTLDYPANDRGVIAVGASALCDGAAPRDYGSSYEYVAHYSNYTGDLTKDFVVAPGGDPSTAQIGCPGTSCIDYLQWILNLYTTTRFDHSGSQNVLIAGTSMAAPHVAGLAALLLSKNPSLTPRDVARLIETTATNINDSRQGHGRVDANAALGAVP